VRIVNKNFMPRQTKEKKAREGKVYLSLRVHPGLIVDLDEAAVDERRTRSQLGAALLEWAVRQRARVGSTDALLKRSIDGEGQGNNSSSGPSRNFSSHSEE
jgi:hypothetical protein